MLDHLSAGELVFVIGIVAIHVVMLVAMYDESRH